MHILKNVIISLDLKFNSQHIVLVIFYICHYILQINFLLQCNYELNYSFMTKHLLADLLLSGFCQLLNHAYQWSPLLWQPFISLQSISENIRDLWGLLPHCHETQRFLPTSNSLGWKQLSFMENEAPTEAPTSWVLELQVFSFYMTSGENHKDQSAVLVISVFVQQSFMSSYIGCKISSSFKELLSFLAFLLVLQSSLIHFLLPVFPIGLPTKLALIPLTKLLRSYYLPSPPCSRSWKQISGQQQNRSLPHGASVISKVMQWLRLI